MSPAVAVGCDGIVDATEGSPWDINGRDGEAVCRRSVCGTASGRQAGTWEHDAGQVAHGIVKAKGAGLRSCDWVGRWPGCYWQNAACTRAGMTEMCGLELDRGGGVGSSCCPLTAVYSLHPVLELACWLKEKSQEFVGLRDLFYKSLFSLALTVFPDLKGIYVCLVQSSGSQTSGPAQNCQPSAFLPDRHAPLSSNS